MFATAQLHPSLDIWQFRAHPEVWVLVLGLAAAYVYAIRVIGPTAGVVGPIVTRKQVWCFVAGLGLLWVVSDWPVHDLAEQYLYSVHMVQHMVLSYFMPPLLLLSMPEWLARLFIGRPGGRTHGVLSWLTMPVVAGVAFNAWLMVTHIPTIVNLSATNGVLHYVLHVVLVSTSLMMWMPLCGPIPEFHRGPGGQMIYLFAMSVVPTVPAGWLTFADKPVYKIYDHPVRAFGLSVQQDQQMAGVIMKVGGSVFLWILITRLFFKRFMAGSDESHTFRRLEDVVPLSSQLTYGDVTDAFAASEPVPEGTTA
jgi:putative membrane protein